MHNVADLCTVIHKMQTIRDWRMAFAPAIIRMCPLDPGNGGIFRSGTVEAGRMRRSVRPGSGNPSPSPCDKSEERKTDE